MSMSSMSYEESIVNRAEKFKDLALEYLNENYDDTFTAKSYSGKDWATSYRTVTFYSEKFPDYSVVKVQIHDNDDGSYYFVDNYYQCYMYDDATAYFESIAKEIESITVKVSFQGQVYSDWLNGATSFAEWVANGSCQINVSFITLETLSDEDMYSIVQEIADNKISGLIWFITTSSVDDTVESKSSYFINYKFEITKNY